jgi:hypothetical protein
MNPMYDFTRDEIGFLQMGLMAIAQSTREAVEREGVEPPDGFIETLHSVVEKINEVIKLRIANEEQFDSLIETLTDVENKSQSVISNPDSPINEYN